MGKAYGFFDCRALKEEIEAELPTIRRLVQTPSELELKLSLNEGVEVQREVRVEDVTIHYLKWDIDLISIARAAKNEGIVYVMEANYPNETNKRTADKLTGILNQAYQSSLFDKGETFRGEIVYEEDGVYVFRE